MTDLTTRDLLSLLLVVILKNVTVLKRVHDYGGPTLVNNITAISTVAI